MAAINQASFFLPTPPSVLLIVNMHTPIATMDSFYCQSYKGKYENVFDFIKAMYEGRNVEAIDHFLEILNGKITDYSTKFSISISSHLSYPICQQSPVHTPCRRDSRVPSTSADIEVIGFIVYHGRLLKANCA